MELRAKIVPQYVPALYLGDPENNVFIMEDVSNLKLIRFQMNKNHLFPELAKQGAQYLAATHFILQNSIFQQKNTASCSLIS